MREEEKQLERDAIRTGKGAGLTRAYASAYSAPG